MVKKGWSATILGSPQFILHRKLLSTKREFIWWNKNVFGVVQTNLLRIKAALEAFQQNSPSEANTNMENLLSNEYQEYLKREEILWHQKSRIQWLTTPDLNTRYMDIR